MQALLAVFLEDLRRRRILFGLAAFLGLTAVALPMVSSRLTLPPNDLRQAASMAFLGLFLGLTPLFLGADLFAPQQANGRLGFFLARPLRPWQLLWGRLASALAACFGGALLIALPSWLLGVNFAELLLTEHRDVLAQTVSLSTDSVRFVLYLPFFGVGLAEPLPPLLWLGLPFVLLALGHVLSVFVRLGGWWSLFDLLAAWWIGRMLIARHFELLSLHAVVTLWHYFFAVFAGAAILGMWLQLRCGGTERSRLHRLSSLAVTVPLLLATFAAGIWIDRLEERGPRHLERVFYATASDSGDRAVVVGEMGTHLGGFFIDRGSDSWRHFPIVDSWHYPTFVGEDFFWTECIVTAVDRLEDTRCRLLSTRLVRARHPDGLPDLRHLEPGLGLRLGESVNPRLVDLHPGGERVALVRGGKLQVVSWPDREVLRTAPPPDELMWVRYDENGRLRTWSASAGTVRQPREILVSELAADGLQPVGSVEGTPDELPAELKPPRPRFEIGPRTWDFDREAGCVTIPEGGERVCFGELSGLD